MHRAGSFSSLTPAMPLRQQNVCKMQGLLVRKASGADVESGLKSRHVHCMSLGKISRYKNVTDALEGHAGVKTWPLPAPCCVTLLTDVFSSSFDIQAHTGLQVKLISDVKSDKFAGE